MPRPILSRASADTVCLGKVAVRNNRDVPVRDVLVLVRHTTGTYTMRFPLIAPGEVVIHDNPEGDDYWGFFFRTWAQGYLAP